MKPSTRLMERDIVTDRTLSSLFERPTTAQFLRRCGCDWAIRRCRGEVAWYDLSTAPALAEWNVVG